MVISFLMAVCRVSRVGGYDFVSTPMLQAGVRNQVFFAAQTFYPLIIGRPILERLYYLAKFGQFGPGIDH